MDDEFPQDDPEDLEGLDWEISHPSSPQARAFGHQPNVVPHPDDMTEEELMERFRNQPQSEQDGGVR